MFLTVMKGEEMPKSYEQIKAEIADRVQFVSVVVGVADVEGAMVGIHGKGFEGVVEVIAELLDHNPEWGCFAEIDGDVYGVKGDGEYSEIPGARWGVTHGEV